MQQYQDSPNWDQKGYQLTSAPILWHKFENYSYECAWKNDGDILEMILDLNDRTLRFKMNDKDYGIAFDEVDTNVVGYRLALTMCECDESIFQLL